MPTVARPSSPRRQWMLVSIVWVVPAILATINTVLERRLNGEPPANLRQLLWAGGDWLVYAFMTPVIFWVARRWPIARPFLARRVALHVGVALLFCVGWATSGTLLQMLLGSIFDPRGWQALVDSTDGHFWLAATKHWAGWVLTTLPFGVIVYLSIAGIAHAIRYFAEASEREAQLARLSEQLAGARFAALQAQVNPHFLFNTLNTIAVLVRDGDRTGAVRIVEQLSDVLRRTMTRHNANEVTLEEELELVRQYLAIEQARFSDRLRPEFDVDPAIAAAAVPSFALQHLVENAIRHGIAKRTDAGRVVVRARRLPAAATGMSDRLQIVVTDDGTSIDPARPWPAGRGLDSTRERLRALYGDAASLTLAAAPGHGVVATLEIPYRAIDREADRDPR